jgi:alkylation response protein AidB-like acyl-CoA dehydrogenase
MTTGMIDRNDPSCEVEAACCKVFGSEKSFEAINEAIQIMGGMGFMKVRDHLYNGHALKYTVFMDIHGYSQWRVARCLHVYTAK